MIATFFTATYIGRSEFYSGVRHGDRVTVRADVQTYDFENEIRTSLSCAVQSIADPGAWLTVYNGGRGVLEDITRIEKS